MHNTNLYSLAQNLAIIEHLVSLAREHVEFNNADTYNLLKEECLKWDIAPFDIITIARERNIKNV